MSTVLLALRVAADVVARPFVHNPHSDLHPDAREIELLRAKAPKRADIGAVADEHERFATTEERRFLQVVRSCPETAYAVGMAWAERGSYQC